MLLSLGDRVDCSTYLWHKANRLILSYSLFGSRPDSEHSERRCDEESKAWVDRQTWTSQPMEPLRFFDSAALRSE